MNIIQIRFECCIVSLDICEIDTFMSEGFWLYFFFVDIFGIFLLHQYMANVNNNITKLLNSLVIGKMNTKSGHRRGHTQIRYTQEWYRSRFNSNNVLEKQQSEPLRQMFQSTRVYHMNNLSESLINPKSNKLTHQKQISILNKQRQKQNLKMKGLVKNDYEDTRLQELRSYDNLREGNATNQQKNLNISSDRDLHQIIQSLKPVIQSIVSEKVEKFEQKLSEIDNRYESVNLQNQYQLILSKISSQYDSRIQQFESQLISEQTAQEQFLKSTTIQIKQLEKSIKEVSLKYAQEAQKKDIQQLDRTISQIRSMLHQHVDESQIFVDEINQLIQSHFSHYQSEIDGSIRQIRFQTEKIEKQLFQLSGHVTSKYKNEIMEGKIDQCGRELAELSEKVNESIPDKIAEVIHNYNQNFDLLWTNLNDPNRLEQIERQ